MISALDHANVQKTIEHFERILKLHSIKWDNQGIYCGRVESSSDAEHLVIVWGLSFKHEKSIYATITVKLRHLHMRTAHELLIDLISPGSDTPWRFTWVQPPRHTSLYQVGAQVYCFLDSFNNREPSSAYVRKDPFDSFFHLLLRRFF